MKWPALIPKWVLTTPITITVTNGKKEDGAPNIIKSIETKCNYSEKQKRELTPEKHLITFSSTAYFDGDIAEDIEKLEGFVLVHGSEKQIYRCERGRNPDGSVNFTRLDLL